MESSLHGGSTSSDFPLIPVRKKIQKTRKARFHRRFFGNLVMPVINEQTALKFNSTRQIKFWITFKYNLPPGSPNQERVGIRCGFIYLNETLPGADPLKAITFLLKKYLCII